MSDNHLKRNMFKSGSGVLVCGASMGLEESDDNLLVILQAGWPYIGSLKLVIMKKSLQ